MRIQRCAPRIPGLKEGQRAQGRAIRIDAKRCDPLVSAVSRGRLSPFRRAPRRSHTGPERHAARFPGATPGRTAWDVDGLRDRRPENRTDVAIAVIINGGPLPACRALETQRNPN
jgi:hypothetical protein